ALNYFPTVDYNAEGRDSKVGKGLVISDERFDSGVDSLKEDECKSVAAELERVSLSATASEPRAASCGEAWRTEINEDGDTYLHLAIIHEATEYATKMIGLSTGDPFLNTQNYQRQTPLHLAVIMDQPVLVARLLRAGCDPQLVDDEGNTALHIACKKGSLACFSVLTQTCHSSYLPALLKSTNYSGHNCLHVASLHGFLSLVENLISLGADINAQEKCNGRTSLHLAVDLQNLNLVELLVTKGTDVNRLTYGGHTAYHLTYGRNNNAIQKRLYDLTSPDLRELPESESEDSEVEEEDSQSEDDMVCLLFIFHLLLLNHRRFWLVWNFIITITSPSPTDI
uniref:NF-kappa-B inhibitor alpha n=1 Tax=Denticeps clupeoides TaxID=299321 RepID=A0AAY4BCB8_9TELE